jgi:hypothetical protein
VSPADALLWSSPTKIATNNKFRGDTVINEKEDKPRQTLTATAILARSPYQKDGTKIRSTLMYGRVIERDKFSCQPVAQWRRVRHDGGPVHERRAQKPTKSGI